MSGPFLLTRYGINREVPKNTPGAYVLGGVRLKPNYEGAQAVGRAETDLAAALETQIGLYDAFLFRATGSAEDAFRPECELYPSPGPPRPQASPPAVRHQLAVSDLWPRGR